MTEEKNIKSQIISSLLWKFMERGGTQGIQFIVSIVLARLLTPEDYGVIALITIFIAIADVFVQSGFSIALIQKKNADEIDFSSVFYLSLFVSGVLYVVLFFTAPFIAAFYREPQLTLVLRVLSFTLFLGATNSLQSAVVSRTMQFKRFFFSSLGGVIASGIIGIAMAYMGFGVWALVGQQLTNNLLITIILWFTVKWRPKLLFSIERVKCLFSFGWKLLCASLIGTTYDNLYGLVIGKIYNSQMLGYYNRGSQFPLLIVNNIDGSVQSVMLPALSANQDDKAKIKTMVKRSIVTSSFIVFPMMTGLAVCAEPLIRVLLTDKWLTCVPFLQLMCITYALKPIQTANLQAIIALGRSDLFLKLEIVKRCIGLISLWISIPFGIYAMVGLQPFVALISSLINAFPNKKLLGYSYKDQWQDIMPSLLLSLVMGILVYGIQFIGLSMWTTLIFQICVGAVLYVGMAWIFKLECFRYLLDTIRGLLHRRTN